MNTNLPERFKNAGHEFLASPGRSTLQEILAPTDFSNESRVGVAFRRKNGRGGEIRTHDLLYPKQARYQATLRPDPEPQKVAITPPFGN